VSVPAIIGEVALWGATLFFVAITVTGSLTKGYYRREKRRRVPRSQSKAARTALRTGDFEGANAALKEVMKRRAMLEVHRGVALDISVTFALLGLEMMLAAGYLIGPLTVVVIVVQLLLATVWVFGLRGSPRVRRNSHKFLDEQDAENAVRTEPEAPSSLLELET
jgi:Flp pilus assembly protein TadB